MLPQAFVPPDLPNTSTMWITLCLRFTLVLTFGASLLYRWYRWCRSRPAGPVKLGRSMPVPDVLMAQVAMFEPETLLRARFQDETTFYRKRLEGPGRTLFEKPYGERLTTFLRQHQIDLLDLPQVRDIDAYHGWTNYIDRVPVSALGAPLSRFVDRYGRPGVCVRLVHPDETACVAVFQRYSETPNVWVIGTRYDIPGLMDLYHEHSRDSLLWLDKVLTGAHPYPWKVA